MINTSTQAGLPERALIGLIVHLSAHIGEIRSGVDERIGLLSPFHNYRHGSLNIRSLYVNNA